MKKNEVGRVLKVMGVLAIVLGTLGSLILGFNTEVSPMDEMLGYMGQTTLTYNFGQVLPSIFKSIIAGVLLIGLSEIIFILDEQRENSRRLCHRFGINPVETGKFNGPRPTGRPNYNGPVNNGPVNNGPASNGPVSNGPVNNNPVNNGPANNQIHENRPVHENRPPEVKKTVNHVEELSGDDQDYGDE